ncbi:MAG: flagellar filament outer layer protein FlaA [Spirochaetota bacterium]|jgi:hypothetical protein|nr:flagellar filament outer layer protein FlaA [Spirochaetota bacterium]
MSALSKYIPVFTILIISLPVFIFGLAEMTVIDFGNYEKLITNELNAMNEGVARTRVDGTPGFILPPETMYVSNWIVELRSAMVRVPNILKSQCIAVESKEYNQTVLGIRINFPESRQNDRAYIRPQFPLFAYNRQGNFANVSNGIIVNVGVVKDVSIWVKGRNYPYDIAARLTDNNNVTREFFFGNMFFDNWRKLTWVNPNYIDSLKDRVVERKPMYPKDIPYYRFNSFVVYRDMAQIGGDFVFYIKNLTMTHDLYTTTMIDQDIDDEAVWKILRQRTLEDMDREHRALGERSHDFGVQKGLMEEKPD